jgi:cytochrome P450
LATLPEDLHPQVAIAMIGEKYNLGNVYYIDLWPIAPPFLMIQDPEVAARITQTQNHPKHELLKIFLRNMTGEKAVVTSEGSEWRVLRSILGPAFSSNHIASVLPDITDQVMIFRQKLEEFARQGRSFEMQPLACSLTFDVIGKMVLGKSFNALPQNRLLGRRYHELHISN